jgi:hypothetical protein
MRALQPHRQTVSEKFAAIGAKGDFLLFNLFDIEKSEGKGGPLSIVIFPAVDPHKPHQYLDIVLLFF